MNPAQLLPFLLEADRLKKIERQALIHSGGRRENSAEHSWHLALSVMVMAKCAPEPIDTLRALMMAIVHDLVEIDAGDTFFYGLTEDKTIQEQKAIERLTGLLPSAVGEELKTIWTEFEAGQSPEAKFVSALDRFLPIYSNMQNDGYSWKNHGVSVDQVRARCEKPISDGLPELWKLTDALLSESVAKGQFTARE